MVINKELELSIAHMTKRDSELLAVVVNLPFWQQYTMKDMSCRCHLILKP